MATSLGILNKPHANGINSSEPPATPDEPQADTPAITQSNNAVLISTLIPKVLTAAMVITLMVIAAPAILIVAPSGIETEYVSSSKPSLSHKAIFTGILAAELRVKNAVIPLSLRQVKIRG